MPFHWASLLGNDPRTPRRYSLFSALLTRLPPSTRDPLKTWVRKEPKNLVYIIEPVRQPKIYLRRFAQTKDHMPTDTDP